MIGTELLDDRRADPRAVRTELRDIARLNALFGGTRAVLDALEPFFRNSCNVQRATCPAAARLTRDNGVAVVMGDGEALPFAAKSVDVVIASQVLHHLPRAVAVRWIAGFDRVARRAVVLADLRRSHVAMAGMWLAGYALRMGATTRHDAVVSLRRGYTRAEFTGMLREAGVAAVARYRPGFRIVAAWETSDIRRQTSETSQLTSDV